VPIGASHHQRQRHAAPVYDEMALAAELAAIRRVPTTTFPRSNSSTGRCLACDTPSATPHRRGHEAMK
jgi:hypothetical protein